MSHEAFQQAIFNEPDDDALRLIYADWLDENNEPLWAEYIRLQCDLAASTPASDRFVNLSEREEELTILLTDRIHTAPLTIDADELGLASISFPSWSRGFPDSIRLEQLEPYDTDAEQMNRICDRLETLIPQSTIQHFYFDDFHPDLIEVLFERDVLKLARSLTLDWFFDHVEDVELEDRADVQAEHIAQAPQLSQLRSLHLDCILSDRGLQALAKSSCLTSLENLNLWTSASPVGLKDLADSPLAQRLRCLILSEDWLDNQGVEALSQTSWPRLHSLDLSYSSVREDTIRALGQSNAFPNLAFLNLGLARSLSTALGDLLKNDSWKLRMLDLAHSDLGSRDAQLLARSPLLKNVHTLSLRGNVIGIQGIRALAKSPHLSQLRRLDLAYNDWDGNKLLALTKGELCQHLTTLQLQSSQAHLPFTEGNAFIKALELPQIRHLMLTGNSLGARGVKTLVEKDWFQNIRMLNLRTCRIGKAGAEALLEALDPEKMVYLNVSDNDLPTKIRERFVDRLGEHRVIVD